MGETQAKRSGELCAATRTADAVDAAVVLSAAARGDAILTVDPKDLKRLSDSSGLAVVAL